MNKIDFGSFENQFVSHMSLPTQDEIEHRYAQLEHLPPDQCGWNHPRFREMQQKLEEENNFIERPIVDIAEGIMQCSKCKSFKTFSYQKQVRSSDEGFTLFVNCVTCNSSWVEN